MFHGIHVKIVKSVLHYMVSFYMFIHLLVYRSQAHHHPSLVYACCRRKVLRIIQIPLLGQCRTDINIVYSTTQLHRQQATPLKSHPLATSKEQGNKHIEQKFWDDPSAHNTFYFVIAWSLWVLPPPSSCQSSNALCVPREEKQHYLVLWSTFIPDRWSLGVQYWLLYGLLY